MSFCSDNFPDDPAITNETNLFRRIPPTHHIFDVNLNRWRPTSAAFEDDDELDPMSVYLSTVLTAENRSPATVLVGHPGYSLASITAGLARTKGQTVHPDPLPEETSHAVVCGDKGNNNKSAPKKQFALNAVWFVLNPPAAPAVT
jgi:hypothetical protein